MHFVCLSSCLGLALAILPGGGPAHPKGVAQTSFANAPRLEVLSGKLRVLAGDGWIELAAGERLPGSRADFSLSLGPSVHARMSVPGAGVELWGPMELESKTAQVWALRLAGSGRVQLEARALELHVELIGSARTQLRHGVAWIEGQPNGTWRISCDAGESLRVCAPAGARWDDSPLLRAGESLRIVPAFVVPPALGRRAPSSVSGVWPDFSWPWAAVLPSQVAADVEHTVWHAAAQALSSAFSARVLAR